MAKKSQSHPGKKPSPRQGERPPKGTKSVATEAREIIHTLAEETGKFIDRIVPAIAKAAGDQAKLVAREIFVVHGHDDAAKQELARVLERLNFKPIILHEQADRGRFVLEKFEDFGDVPYAVVLLTPDDVSGDKARARQNVIFELGYFVGRLGRKHVQALYKPGVELPSDLAGLLYTEMDANGAWKLLLGRELKAAGFGVDLNVLT